MSSLLTNLKAYYNFQGNGNDVSGNGKNATTSNVVFNVANGKIASGMGTNILSTFIASNVVSSGGGAWTVSCWIKTTGSSTYPAVWWLSSTTNIAGIAAGLVMYPTYDLRYVRQMGGAAYSIADLSNGLFHHVVVRWDGAGNISCWDNNVNTFNITDAINLGNGDLEIAYYPHVPPPSYAAFPGSVDEFGVWDRALTVSEISQIYNSGNGLTYPFSPATTNAGILFNLL